MLQKLEVLLTSKSPMQSDINEVTEFYGSDLNKTRLESQLHILHASVDHDLNSVIAYMKSLSPRQRHYFSEIVKIVKLISVIPATNATSERSFSAVRRLKTWLRTTPSQARLNWCMLLHVHKDLTDSISETLIQLKKLLSKRTVVFEMIFFIVTDDLNIVG